MCTLQLWIVIPVQGYPNRGAAKRHKQQHLTPLLFPSTVIQHSALSTQQRSSRCNTFYVFFLQCRRSLLMSKLLFLNAWCLFFFLFLNFSLCISRLRNVTLGLLVRTRSDKLPWLSRHINYSSFNWVKNLKMNLGTSYRHTLEGKEDIDKIYMQISI